MLVEFLSVGERKCLIEDGGKASWRGFLKIFKIYFFSKFFYKLVRPVFVHFSCWFQGVLCLAKRCSPVAHKLRWHAFGRGRVKRRLARETCSVVCGPVGSPLEKAGREPLRGPEPPLCPHPPVPFFTCCDATGNLKKKLFQGNKPNKKLPC